MGFVNLVFPFELQFGMTISVKYKTSVVSTQSLHEERLCSWLDPLRSYSIVPVLFDRTHFQTLGSFFRSVSGRTDAFRLHDPIDHELVNQSIGVGDGARTVWQVYKSYESGIDGDTYISKRPLLKLVAPVIVSVDNVLLEEFDFTVDLDTGLITFVEAPPDDEIVRVSCMFHTPVRFSTNRLGTNHATFEAYNPNGVELLEDRLPMALLANTNIVESQIPGSVEARYPFHEELSDESEFASRYSDQVITFDSGVEQRQRRSAQGYNDYEFKYEVKPLSEIQRLLAFYHCRKGKYSSFRLRDINDYEALNQPLGVGDGIVYEFQMTKVYATGSESEIRTITKPVEGTISLYANGSLLVLPTEHMSIDYATGKVLYFLTTLNLNFDADLHLISRLAGSWITDGLTIGDKVSLVGSLVNDGVFTVVAVTDLDLEVSETIAAEETVGVAVYLPPEVGLILTWSGDFDVPVRFNTDELKVSINGFEPYNVDNLSFQEIHCEPLEAIYFERPAFTSGPLVCAGSPSALLSTPDVAVASPVLHLSYSLRGGFDSKTIHNTWKGISSWTFFAVFSHSKRGVLFDVPQGYPQIFPVYTLNGDSIYPRPTALSLSTRVFIRSQPSDKAVLFIEGWNGDNTLKPYFNALTNKWEDVDWLEPDEVYSGKLDPPLYVCPETTVYEPVTALIITFSYFSARAYVSGTTAGVVRLDQSGYPYLDTAIIGEDGTVLNRKDRYMSGPSPLWYATYPFFGAFSPAIGGEQSPFPAGSLGRFYEVYFAQYYQSLTAETELIQFKALHNYLIRYLEAKYLYRRKAALALEGTRGHWLASRASILTHASGVYPNEVHRPAEVGESIYRWLPDPATGSLCMVQRAPAELHPYTLGTLVEVEPNQIFLTEPLHAFWD